MITLTEAKQVATKWNKLKKDKDRFQFLRDYNSVLKIVLDNDYSSVGFITDEEEEHEIIIAIEEIELNDFEEDNFYSSDAVINLFEFAGIVAESC